MFRIIITGYYNEELECKEICEHYLYNEYETYTEAETNLERLHKNDVFAYIEEY